MFYGLKVMVTISDDHCTSFFLCHTESLPQMKTVHPYHPLNVRVPAKTREKEPVQSAKMLTLSSRGGHVVTDLG